MDSDNIPTPDPDGSLRDSPIATILIVLVVSLALVGASYAILGPDAEIAVEENEDNSATVEVSDVDGYDEIVLQYDEEEITIEEGETVTVPADTDYKIVGVFNDDETVLKNDAT